MYEQTVRSMGHLFISYSRTDRGYAERLVTYLEAAGVDVWVDHGDIPPGSRYRRTIEAAIDACDALLVLMTPAARESTWVENELDWAERHRKPIFTLLLEGQVWFGLTATHYENVTNLALPTQRFIDALPPTTKARPENPTLDPTPPTTAPSNSTPPTPLKPLDPPPRTAA